MVAAGLVGGEGSAHIVGGGGGGVTSKDPFGNIVEDFEQERKKEKARQRWKILCLVKTSDPKTDVAARQERITEKVDDWMRKMVMKMHIADDEDETNKISSKPILKTENNESNSFKNLGNNLFTQSNQTPIQLKTPNHVVPKNEMQRLQKKEETKELKEQRDRMRAREKAEWERERQLILDGKLKLKKEHLQKQDPVLKLHHEKIRMKKKASKGSRSPKPSTTRKFTGNVISGHSLHTTTSSGTGPGSTTSSMSGSKSAIKLRWSSAMNRVKANALLEKKKRAAEIEKLRQEQEEFEEEIERGKLLRVNRRKGGIIGGPPHPLYHHLKANRLSTYYNAYDEVGTYLDAQNNEAHETMNDVEDATETVVAQLLYDEGKDELKSDLDELTEDTPYKDDNDNKNIDNVDGQAKAKKESTRLNPVYAALDDAKDVDDMFRIAEIWVNPSSYI